MINSFLRFAFYTNKTNLYELRLNETAKSSKIPQLILEYMEGRYERYLKNFIYLSIILIAKR